MLQRKLTRLHNENLRNHARAVVADGVTDLTIIIPTLNEASSLRSLLPSLLGLYPLSRIVIVDDGSLDGTEQVVESFQDDEDGEEALQIVQRRGESVKGLTASVIDGVLGCNTKYLIVMDGDLQHPPEHIINTYLQLRSGADISVSCRLPYREQQPWIRKFITWLTTIISKIVLHRRGIQVQDPMSGFFGGRTVLLKEIIIAHRNSFELKGYKILFELLRVAPNSVQVGQTFYSFGVRPEGSSKLRARHGFYFFRSLFR